MRWIIALCMISAMAVVGSLLVAQDAPATPKLVTTEQAKQLTTRFLGSIAAGTTFDAFGLMKSAAPGSENEIDMTRDQTMGMLDQLRATYGKPIGYDLIAERTLGGTIIRYEAMLKLEKAPLRCSVTFYKPADAWVPMRVDFGEDIESLFIELGR